MAVDEILNRIRNQIPDRGAACNPLADFCGGEVEAALEAREVVGVGGGAATVDDEADGGAQFVDTAPCVEQGKIVFAEKEEEFGVWVEGTEGVRGIDAVAWALAGEFQRAEGETLFAFDRGGDHLCAEKARGRVGVVFVGRVCSRDEEDEVELQLLEGVPCEDEVSVMDGVEAAAKEGDAARRARFAHWVHGAGGAGIKGR